MYELLRRLNPTVFNEYLEVIEQSTCNLGHEENVNSGLESLACLKPKDLEHNKNLRKQQILKLQLKNRIQVHPFGDQAKYTSRI